MTTYTDQPTVVDLNSLNPGAVVDVETMSRHYHIECLGGERGPHLRSSRILPCARPDILPGFHRQGRCGTGLIETGLRLVFFVDGHQPITMSRGC